MAALYHTRAGTHTLAIRDGDYRAGTSPSCNDLHHCRTLWSIIWSCLATILACTWIAVHPNITSPAKNWYAVARRRLLTMLIALLAPEMIVGWAMRQWLTAGEIVEDQRRCGRKWTQVHGFFAIMGGFMVFENHRPLYPLDPDQIDDMVGDIDFPSITAEEIKDKSKGDILSKAVAVIQTTWFVTQCMARGFERLPITEFEIATLAFGTLNLMTYWFWWNKPQDVRYPVRVELKFTPDIGCDSCETGRVRGARPKDQSVGLFWKVFHGLSRLMLGEENVDLATVEQVPMFYSGKMRGNTKRLAGIAETAVAIVFGGIHCIAWSFSYHSRAEQIIWRASCIAVICVPVIFWVLSEIGILCGWGPGDSWINSVRPLWLKRIVGFAVTVCVFAYCAGRVALMVVAFTSLRSPSPSPEVFKTIYWTTFFPHL